MAKNRLVVLVFLVGVGALAYTIWALAYSIPILIDRVQ